MPATAETPGRPPASRTQRTAWSFASGLGQMGLTIGGSLIVTPWLLAWLGRERYGAWRVLLDCFAYLALFDLGFGGALMGLLAPALGRGDASGARQAVGSGLAIYRKITVAMLAGGVILTLLLPRIIPNLDSGELRLAGWIMVLPVIWTPALVFRVLAEARQQSYLVNFSLMGQYALITALSLVAAKLQWGLPGQAGAQAIGLLVPALLLVWIGVRKFAPVSAGADAGRLNSALWKLNWPTLVFNISGRVSLLSDNILVAWAMGPAAAAPFYLTQRLAAMAQLQLQGMGNATWAALVEMHARGDAAGLRSRLLELTGMVSGLGLALLAPIAAYNRQFMQHWLGPATYAGDAVSLLACLNGWLWSIFSLWGWPLSGTGKIGAWAPYSVVFLVVNLGVSLAATFKVGMTGPLLGTLTGFLFVTSWAMPRVLHQEFGIRPRHLFAAAARPLLLGAPYAVLVGMVARSHTARGWIGLAAEMAGAALGGVAVWWFTGLSRSARNLWRGRFGAMCAGIPWIARMRSVAVR
jgi:O-antigen/teichoic acid export membrane protein